MSWRVIGAGYYPFGFVDPPEHLTAENDTTYEMVRYVPERTCKNIHAQKVTLDCFRCSECGAATGWTRIDIDNVLFPFRYCPNCGAKIEKESWWSE